MSVLPTWPFNLVTFGGMRSLTQRVAKSQEAGYSARLQMMESGKDAVLRVEFIRSHFYCRYLFVSRAGNPMALQKASAVSLQSGSRYGALSLDVGIRTAKIAVAFDHASAYSLRTNTTGIISDFALPFAAVQVRVVPSGAIRSMALNGGILGSWSLLSLVAFCRCSDKALHEVLSHQESLKQDMVGMFEETSNRYGLRVGSGTAALALPSCRLHGRHT